MIRRRLRGRVLNYEPSPQEQKSWYCDDIALYASDENSLATSHKQLANCSLSDFTSNGWKYVLVIKNNNTNVKIYLSKNPICVTTLGGVVFDSTVTSVISASNTNISIPTEAGKYINNGTVSALSGQKSYYNTSYIYSNHWIIKTNPQSFDYVVFTNVDLYYYADGYDTHNLVHDYDTWATGWDNTWFDANGDNEYPYQAIVVNNVGTTTYFESKHPLIYNESLGAWRIAVPYRKNAEVVTKNDEYMGKLITINGVVYSGLVYNITSFLSNHIIYTGDYKEVQ